MKSEKARLIKDDIENRTERFMHLMGEIVFIPLRAYGGFRFLWRVFKDWYENSSSM